VRENKKKKKKPFKASNKTQNFKNQASKQNPEPHHSSSKQP
jgi:hypothetical protein